MIGPRPGVQHTITQYLGLIQFSHTIFALPFAAMSMILAWNTPLPGGGDTLMYPPVRWTDMVAVLIAMVTARTAAMAVNRLLDRHIDAKNPRTTDRHIPAGRISVAGALTLTIVSAVGFVASTLLFWPNWIPLALSIPVLAFLMGYSLAKRFTSAAHGWLGVALALSPICVWIAIRGVDAAMTVSDYALPGLTAAMVAFWVTGFDIIYACQDAEFDRQSGLHSVPARLGVAGALRTAAALHLIMIPLLGLLAYQGRVAGLGIVFAATVVIVAGLVVHQHRLVRPDDLSRVGQAFFQTNAIISVVLLVAVAIDCGL